MVSVPGLAVVLVVVVVEPVMAERVMAQAMVSYFLKWCRCGCLGSILRRVRLHSEIHLDGILEMSTHHT